MKRYLWPVARPLGATVIFQYQVSASIPSGQKKIPYKRYYVFHSLGPCVLSCQYCECLERFYSLVFQGVCSEDQEI